MIKESWESYVIETLKIMQKSMNTRDFGKLVAPANEILQSDWINQNTNLVLVDREDEDHNESGYDLVTESGLKIQCKFRSADLHLENTRRHSNKNQGNASRTGHTAYSLGEADVYVFTIPKDKKDRKSMLRSPLGVDLLAIPERALADPDNPGFLKTRVLMPVFREFQHRAKEVLENLDLRKRTEISA